MTVPTGHGQPLTTLPSHRLPVSPLADPVLQNSALGGELPDTAAVVARLRHHLRTVLSAELPERVEAAHRRSTIDHDERKALAWAILDEAAAAHSEAELMANRLLVAKDAEQQVITEVINEVFGMAGLQPLLDDPTVETINVNRFDRVLVQYRDGHRAQVAPIAASNDELTNLVRMLAARASSEERRFDRGAPAVNLQLPGGERLFAVMALTSDGVTALSIRRHGYRTVTLPQLRNVGTVDFGLEQFLRLNDRTIENSFIHLKPPFRVYRGMVRRSSSCLEVSRC
jgi:pilus assembly protein CpaF